MTPAGTSNELDVQNGWEENTHTHICYTTVQAVAPVVQLVTSKLSHVETGVRISVQSHELVFFRTKNKNNETINHAERVEND